MQSEIKVFTRENGEIQRVQVVRFDDWANLDFLCPKQESAEDKKNTLTCFYDIYKNFLVPVAPWIFPQMVMFSVPDDIVISDGKVLKRERLSQQRNTGGTTNVSSKYGEVKDVLTAASIILEKGVKLRRGKPVFSTKEAEKLWSELESQDCLRIVCGKFPKTKIIPVGNHAGYLSKCETDAKMKVNAHFFIMDPFDCATIYDQIGMPFGLCVKDGVVINPPLFEREVLLIEKNGQVSIQPMDVKDLEIEIHGVRFKHGENATIYRRPERLKTPKTDGICVVIIGNRVVAVKNKGPVDIPAAGFVLRVDKDSFIEKKILPNGMEIKQCPLCEEDINYVEAKPGDEVIYHGLEDIEFGIQVGNSIIREGKKTNRFISKFYNIYRLERVPFPPSLYPMDFENARAARMAMGADKEGKPVIFWAEGKGKLSYVPGEDSTGASLTEMADIAEEIGMYNAINLDGGGSAQVLLNNTRVLHISDRNKADNSDAERLVPMGLIVR